MSSETHSSELIPSPYFTSSFDTALLLLSDAQTSFLSGNLFSEVIIPTPVPARIRLPEYYTADLSNLQPLILPTIHIPDTEYTRLPPLKLPSELSTTTSKLYPPLKLLGKPSTSLSNLLDNTSEYTPSQETTSSAQTLQLLIYPLFLAILH